MGSLFSSLCTSEVVKFVRAAEAHHCEETNTVVLKGTANGIYELTK